MATRIEATVDADYRSQVPRASSHAHSSRQGLKLSVDSSGGSTLLDEAAQG